MKLAILGMVLLLLPQSAPAEGVILLTRHGDRDTLAEDLNARGRARAEALVAAVAEFDIAAIYSPPKQRNLDTAAPLAAARGLPVQILEPRQALDVLRQVPDGRAVIWIGNTDNLEAIFRALGGTGQPPEFYGDLYVARIGAGGQASFEARSYGP